jgi:hypothetical protein
MNEKINVVYTQYKQKKSTFIVQHKKQKLQDFKSSGWQYIQAALQGFVGGDKQD